MEHDIRELTLEIPAGMLIDQAKEKAARTALLEETTVSFYFNGRLHNITQQDAMQILPPAKLKERIFAMSDSLINLNNQIGQLEEERRKLALNLYEEREFAIKVYGENIGIVQEKDLPEV